MAAAIEETTASGKAPNMNSRHKVWWSRTEESIIFLRKLVPDWRINEDYRRGKQFATEDDCDRIQIPFDWAATKAKQAQLFSVVPEVRLTPKAEQYAQGVPVFAKKLNDLIGRARVGTAMDECLPDVINAAGIASVIVAYESRADERQIPKQDPALAAMQQPSAAPLGAPPVEGAAPQAPQPEMRTVAYATTGRYTCSRVSPADMLGPFKQFMGSDMDDAPWQGRRGRTTWSDAKARFKLKDSDREKVVGQDNRTDEDRLSNLDEPRITDTDPVVEYRELFYWRYLYHPEELCYEAIHHMVFVNGIDDRAVIDEEWKGQTRVNPTTVVGSCKPPVRYLTLTYMSDECIPPSDSAIGRPQVNELIRSRSLQLRQKETSLPMRWMNTNLVDPLVQSNLLRGTWQTIIPLNGTGDKAMGEIARASYPADDKYIDDVAKGDLTEAWQVSSNQLASRSGPAIRSAAEANIVQQNFQTRVGYERARVVNFFVGIAEVLAGLMCVVGDFTSEERQALQAWDLQHLSNYYFYTVRADASVLLDSQQRLERLERFLNLTAKSGYVNIKPIVTEMALLSGLNPAEVIIDPPQPKGDPANISVRGTTQDLADPLTLAFMVETGQAPKSESIDAAKKLILQAAQPPQPPAPPQVAPGGAAGAPGGAAPGQSQEQETPMIPTEDAMPKYNTISRVEKRQEDGK